MADIIVLYSLGLLPELEQAPGVGQELCIWSFQSLPPPFNVESANLTVPRTVDGEEQVYYNYPIADLPRAMELCEIGGSRLQQHIADGSDFVQFAACSFGSEGSKAFCAEGIESSEGSTCEDARINNAVTWPQAITMFKITPENLGEFKEFIVNWRDAPEQHRPNIVWAFTPNGYTEPGNEEFGGIQGSIHPGWGNNGGLRAKVVQCDKIDERFIRPLGPNGDFFFGPEAYFDLDDSTKTFSQLAFEEWDRLCGIPIGGVNSDCVIDADLPDTVAPPTEDPPDEDDSAPFAILPYDEKCIYSNEYIGASLTCGSNLNEAWGDNTLSEQFEQQLQAANEACAASFCEAITYASSAGPFVIDEYGFFGCAAEGFRGPENCTEGDTYLGAMRDFVSCTIDASSAAAFAKRQTSEAAKNNTSVAAAEQSFQACQLMTDCDTKTFESVTLDWAARFCVNFFQVLRDPAVNPGDEYAWVEECGYTGDGSADSEIYKNCEALSTELFVTPGPTETEAATPAPTMSGGSTEAPTTAPTMSGGLGYKSLMMPSIAVNLILTSIICFVTFCW
uniref:Uncharacterized protein n=1 Tax=Grammatophora oceanica TaxID=210454 RepID=A0A7S1V6S9_9STRA